MLTFFNERISFDCLDGLSCADKRTALMTDALAPLINASFAEWHAPDRLGIENQVPPISWKPITGSQE